MFAFAISRILVLVTRRTTLGWAFEACGLVVRPGPDLLCCAALLRLLIDVHPVSQHLAAGWPCAPSSKGTRQRIAMSNRWPHMNLCKRASE